MLVSEEPAQEGLAVPALAMLVRAALVPLHALARGLVLVRQVLLQQALLLLAQLLLLPALLLRLGPELLLARNASAPATAAFRILRVHHRRATEEQDEQQQTPDRPVHAAKIASAVHEARKPPRYLRTMVRWILVPFALLALAGCRKEQRTGVPPVGLDVSININLPEYADLQAPGGWVYLTGGSLGLIVYRTSIDAFCVVDRHCPYQPENLCRVVVDDSQVLAADTSCCGSRFLLNGGSVTQGPSSFGLTRYNTTFNGSILRIYN